MDIYIKTKEFVVIYNHENPRLSEVKFFSFESPLRFPIKKDEEGLIGHILEDKVLLERLDNLDMGETLMDYIDYEDFIFIRLLN